MLDRLSEAITDAGIPLERVEGVTGNPILVFQASATAQQQSDAAAIVAAFDWSVATDTTWREGKLFNHNKRESPDVMDDKEQMSFLLRAEAAVLVDEINILRQQIVGIATFTFDPANMANGTGTTSANVAVTGAAFGDFVDVAAPYTLAGIVAIGYVVSAGNVVVRLHNGTGGAVNLASGIWKVCVRRHSVMPDRTLAQARTAIKNKINNGDVDT